MRRLASCIVAIVVVPAALRGQQIGPRELEQRTASTPTLVERYGADTIQRGELRLPAGPGPFPVVVLVHGGCWLTKYADLRYMRPAADALTKAGYATWTIGYHRADETGGGWPGTFRDVGEATDHLRALAKKAPLDTTRVFAIGHSAGAHLALWLASRPKLPSSSPLATKTPLHIRGVVALDGPGDVITAREAVKQPCAGEPFVKLFGGEYEQQPTRWRDGSPIARLPFGVPQALVRGRLDLGLEKVRVDAANPAYVERATLLGDRARVFVADSASHFTMLAPETRAWDIVLHALKWVEVTADGAVAAGVQAPGMPATRKTTVVDTLHGVAIADNYRWLESQQNGDVRDWIGVQRTYADGVIGETATRSSIAARYAALTAEPSASPTRKVKEWEYFTLRRAGEELASIRRRKASPTPTPVDPDGVYETIIDPLEIRADGTTSVGIEGFSNDGALMMYSVRDGGPDEISIRIRDLEKRSDLPDSLPWALYGGASFDADGRGFTYVHRSREVGPRLKHHRLGTSIMSDSVLFGDGLSPTAFLGVSAIEDGKRRLITVSHGWRRNDVVLQDASTGAVTPIAMDLDAHFAPQFIDGRIWMRTDFEASKGRLVVIDPAHVERSAWRTVISAGVDVLDGFSAIDGKLYVTYLHNVSQRIAVFTMAGKPAGNIAVPPFASVSIRGSGKGAALLSVSSLSRPSYTERIDLATGARTPWEPSRVPFDTSRVIVRQVWYTSKDGTKAPMFVMYKKGTRPTKDTPALLHGYGGFTVSLTARFDPRAAIWVEQGGLFAQATLRGGNEFGEAWHKAGMLGNKQHVFDDFQSAAQMLVDSGWTSPAHLAIRGVSNGGLLMGSAITQRPDLFRAAFIGRPDLDIVRFPAFTTANNAPALLEYGDATKADEFAAIRAFSPYQNVRDGVKYPAILFDVGYWDTRVPPWQARKMAARLQAATTSELPVLFYEDPRSGHAGGRSWSQSVDAAARELEFLWRMTKQTAPTS